MKSFIKPTSGCVRKLLHSMTVITYHKWYSQCKLETNPKTGRCKSGKLSHVKPCPTATKFTTPCRCNVWKSCIVYIYVCVPTHQIPGHVTTCLQNYANLSVEIGFKLGAPQAISRIQSSFHWVLTHLYYFVLAPIFFICSTIVLKTLKTGKSAITKTQGNRD